MGILDAIFGVRENLKKAKKMINEGQREAGNYLSDANYDLLVMEYGGYGPIEKARHEKTVEELRRKYRKLDREYHRMVGSKEYCDGDEKYKK